MRITGPTARLPSKRRDQFTSCAEATTPKCLQALYNIPSTPATAAGNGIAIGGSSAQVADLDDLKVCFAFFATSSANIITRKAQSFLAQERPDLRDAPFTMQSVNGTTVQGNSTDSASTVRIGIVSGLRVHPDVVTRLLVCSTLSD